MIYTNLTHLETKTHRAYVKQLGGREAVCFDIDIVFGVGVNNVEFTIRIDNELLGTETSCTALKVVYITKQ